MSRILLVRHGQSTWNADGRWQGQADPPLSDLGVAQALVASRSLDDLDVVWASDLERAHVTARHIAEPQGLAVVTDERLRERHAGEWTGLTRAQIDAQYPGFLAERRRPPGFEANDVLTVRALAALWELDAALDGGTGLVVTHGGVILGVERHLGEELPPIPNLGGRWIGTEGDVFLLGDRVVLVHPDEIEVTTPGQL